MRRYRSSKQLQGEKYLRDRNLLVSPATLRLTEEIKRKAHRTQLKEDAKRVLRLRSRRVSQTLLPRDQSTQTDDEYFAFQEDDVSDTSTEDLIFVPVNPISRLSIIARTVSFCLKLSFTLISVIVICTLIGYYLRVYHLYSRL
jgi:hypothetical protein